MPSLYVQLPSLLSLFEKNGGEYWIRKIPDQADINVSEEMNLYLANPRAYQGKLKFFSTPPQDKHLYLKFIQGEDDTPRTTHYHYQKRVIGEKEFGQMPKLNSPRQALREHSPSSWLQQTLWLSEE
ncbi:MAG: hypothetical protein HY939_05090, partial [Gammaproteobacteria bacterium]|nr:hypothetical protein [Gammaproteobacteria bacterium]